MAFFNYATKEITLKVVYYGPGLSGKTTNLQHLYGVLDAKSRGKFISLATEADRTLFFDFLPVDLGKIRDFSLRFQLYTVPGQIRYNATRKLVLKGADAVIFVADSQREMKEQNIESFENMKENLLSNNIDPESIPLVLQYNKRDLPNILTIDELDHDLNKKDYRYIEAEAVNGKGIKETFEITTRALLKDISKKHRVDILPVKEEGVFVKIREKDSFKIEEVMPASEPVEEPIEIVDAVEDLDAVETVDTLEPIETVNPEDAGAFVDTVAPVDTAVPADTVPSASTTAPMNIAGVMTAAEPMDTRAVDAPKERGSIPESAVSEGPVSPPALPDKELKRIVDSLRELIQSISDTRDTVSNLSQEIRDVASTRSRDMKDVVSAQSHETKDAVSALARELKDTLSVLFSEMNEARKQQTEIVNSLREMRISLAKIKGKRRWFRLW